MSIGLVIVKTTDRPEDVTDVMDLIADERFGIEGYRGLATALCPDVGWTGETGQGHCNGSAASLELTEAGIFLSFADPSVAPGVLAFLIATSNTRGAVVIAQDSGEILTGA